MSVPLLSQDEFFRHLELQSVHVVKFAYRQALKERLRATTRNAPGTPAAKTYKKRTPGTTSSGQKWLSPKASKRVFDKPKEVATGGGVNVNSGRAILETLVNNCSMYRHPRVKEELGEYGVSKLEKTVYVETSSIVERKAYGPPTPVSPMREGEGRPYSCKVLIQNTRTRMGMAATKRKAHSSKELVQPKVDKAELSARRLPSAVAYPGIRPLLAHNERTLRELRKRGSPLPVFSDPSLEREKTEASIECDTCTKRFFTRSGLRKHVNRGHCPVCSQIKHAIEKRSVCQRCVHRLPTGEAKIVSAKLFNGNSAELDPAIACDICTKKFRRRIQMIKHVMSQHASQMHRVDLVKFVGATSAPWVNEC